MSKKVEMDIRQYSDPTSVISTMALSEDMMSKCSEHISAYKSACQDHPHLKSFDLSLQQRTIKVIDSLTTGAENGTKFMSQHEIHMEVSKHLLEVSQDVAKFILESEDKVWESKALKSLVTAYFENTKKTYESLDDVLTCVKTAEIGEHYIVEAVAQFDKESAGGKGAGGKKKRYENTLKELNNFKAMGRCIQLQAIMTTFRLQLIQQQQIILLQRVSEAKKKLDEEIKELGHEYANAKKWSLISNVIFGSVFFLVSVGSIALIATGAGKFWGISGAVSLSLIAVGWVGVHTYLNNKMDALKKQAEALKKEHENLAPVETGIETNQDSLEIIVVLVLQLEKKITSLMKDVDEAIENEGDEVDTQLAIYSIREKVTTLTEKIKEVGDTVARQKEMILMAGIHVLQKINGSG
ncbi:PREDICTED: UPF0496 protein At3g28270-like [Camelina sativa]|uniref:UPF0496 protein At3g28270-like n=1 Tax=Camelina sativa TaxID=90675 RepID=A0ABM0W246_CAMSA|nr:PREDICTED: UPF0496 protein At3g28270-like [Camelina sativa]